MNSSFYYAQQVFGLTHAVDNPYTARNGTCQCNGMAPPCLVRVGLATTRAHDMNDYCKHGPLGTTRRAIAEEEERREDAERAEQQQEAAAVVAAGEAADAAALATVVEQARYMLLCC